MEEPRVEIFNATMESPQLDALIATTVEAMRRTDNHSEVAQLIMDWLQDNYALEGHDWQAVVGESFSTSEDEGMAFYKVRESFIFVYKTTKPANRRENTTY